MSLRNVWKTLRLTVESWIDDGASRLAAALAFYTLLSLAPLVIIAVALAGLWYGGDAARGRVAAELSRFVGRGAAEGVQAVVAAARSPRAGVIGTAAAAVTLSFGASGMFSELRHALNTIWAVKPKPGRGLWGEVRDHLSAFAMVLVVALLLLASLFVSTALSAIGALFKESLRGVSWFGRSSISAARS